ncbi:CRAL/TRIO domain containing protein [Acanthamoeba castellanii str. Neff]|uniref:CRAL/TRIO domain containing protein n=1 Tax=Acanthamoeba castellanii (strain ATCC 30010 / Neff) TaxID=1257118 RepID=L8GXL8_ACACF|nr:CRAL/TRIO domain containing protein [Acanthamoeba castellanii str. Neff]ELR17313.1 CRAL/TRIO domain containing protein [Acanthamoeba castellanii str. Neff]
MIGKTRKDKKEKGKEKGGKSSSREHKPVPSPRDDVLAAVAALRAKVEEEGLKVDYEIHDEWRLAGFVKGAGLDVDKAFLNFTHSLKMRAECGADTVLETAPKTNKNFPLVLKYWPGHYHKHDKDGCPVYYERLGAVDVRGLLNTVPGEDLFNVHVYQQEQSRALKAQLSKEHNRSMYLCIFVQDLSGLSMNHLYTPAFDLFKKILGFDQSNYPDSLKSYYVINSPACLKMMYSLIKPLLDPNTRKKVHILGSNYRDTLLEVIDEEHLPAEYGGECACEGGCIPGGGKFVDLKDDGTTYNPAEVSIGRKDKHEVKLTVAQGATLSWEFTVKSHDVGFGVFFGEGKEREALVAIEKHHGTRKGKLTAEKAGTYWLVWDNTYSILKGKSVEYQAFINADTDDDDDDDDAVE